MGPSRLKNYWGFKGKPLFVILFVNPKQGIKRTLRLMQKQPQLGAQNQNVQLSISDIRAFLVYSK
jgi:hypothetical protein